MTGAWRLLPLLRAALQRHRLRLLFTIASITVAFLLFGLLGAVRTALTAGVEIAGRDRLIATQKVSIIQPLPRAYLGRVRQISGVRTVSSLTWFGGIYQDPTKQLVVFAVDANYFDLYTKELLVDPLERSRWLADRTGALVGAGIAARYGWHVGDTVPLQSNIYRRRDGAPSWPVHILGLYHSDSVDTNQIFLHYEYFNESVSFGKDAIGWILIQVADPAMGPRIAAEVDATFANSNAETKTSSEKAVAQSFANQIGDIGKILDFVVTAVFFAMLLVTANTMAQSVRERTAEIAVLKTLGFTDASVLVLVLAESLLITGVGAALGLFLATAATSGLGAALRSFLPHFEIPARAYGIAVLYALGLGLAAGVLPARQAMRLEIVRALRAT
ncbi:MAG: FtsX-like permease family protein [Pseudomonadota bacterium]